MRGEIVIVRAFKGRPLVRRIWDSNQEVVFITDDENFRLLSMGEEAPMPVGFHYEDVFEYRPEIAESLEELYEKGKVDWSALQRWRAG